MGIPATSRSLCDLQGRLAAEHPTCTILPCPSCALSCVGYGDLVPGTRASYLVSTVEQCVGILLSSLLLGIVVSRGTPSVCIPAKLSLRLLRPVSGEASHPVRR